MTNEWMGGEAFFERQWYLCQAELAALKIERDALKEGVEAFLSYDKHPENLSSMLAYSEALEKCHAAIAQAVQP